MKNRIIAVCDREASYAYSLADYMNQKNSIFFAEAFTSEESLIAYKKDYPISILLISDKMNLDLIPTKDVSLIIYLSEQETITAYANEKALFKYQSAGVILKNMMNYYAEREDEPLAMLHRKCKLIGVYSPIKRCQKTSFCLTLGQIMAKDQAVLYVNMEEYSGFFTLFRTEYKADLSDLIYYLRQEKSNILVKLEGIVETYHGLDYIPPVSSPMDIREVKKEEWLKLFREISTNSKYNTVIVDFGDGSEGLFELLQECNQIYVPYKEDFVSLAKIKQFESLLQMAGYDNILSNLKKIKLPDIASPPSKEEYVQQLIYTQLGDYVKSLIR